VRDELESRYQKLHVPTMFELIGLAHAGGSAASLEPLRRQLPHHIAFRALELPGRGMRRGQSLHTVRPVLVQQLCDELAPRIDRPYALFGHSLGATLAFELAHALIARGCPAPRALFPAASAGPSLRPARPRGRALSDAELEAELRSLGGTPPELFEHPQLLELCLPIVRADFQLCEGASPLGLGPLPCPIHAFAGERDRFSVEQMEAWRLETSREFTLTWLDSDHFMLGTHTAQLCAAVAERLAAAA
jgi:surfactin synthase thioesterase subunit